MHIVISSRLVTCHRRYCQISLHTIHCEGQAVGEAIRAALGTGELAGGFNASSFAPVALTATAIHLITAMRHCLASSR